ncbi:hypothetical protein COU38_03195 [Candidatus Micrarchaeota archaeon CG10_big_fil_rev_8_21_14_0_10_54_18]|nr:MAG: hypothetical protein AUJ15_02500 [Candidatus Micrarchaeota archaeon CG1_02_55_41]PIO03867.1 MAG: hypothetical protein COT57_00315 [Candidatus Micrarchaeota archaeon CG09_land_8_20_14_0_10_55_25]PJD01033.1 MAG: hypothetical protein COU38_03195 [Candidatus Micrarchaeota archaeon CG10_big_fil_rev_8_21_14_0_10_54_18]
MRGQVVLEFFLVATLALLLVYWLNYESASFASSIQGFNSLRLGEDTATVLCRVSDAAFERNQSIALAVPCFNQSFEFAFSSGSATISMNSYPPKTISLECRAPVKDSSHECGKTYLFARVGGFVEVSEA